jgi:Tetratricopeptide repeat
MLDRVWGLALLAVALSPSAPRASAPPARAAAATENYARGLMAQAQGHCDDAVDFWGKAVRLDPDFWEAHREIAQCELKQGHHAQAAEHLREALRVRPQAAGLEDLLARADEGAASVAKASSTRTPQAPVARSTPPPEPSLADLARKKGAKPDAGKVYVLTGSSSGDSPAQAQEREAERQAPMSLLDSMRARAEQVLRPRMSSVAKPVKDFDAAYQHYMDACAGKTTVRKASGATTGTTGTIGSAQGTWVRDDARGTWSLEDAGHYRSESRWNEYWDGVTVLRNEDTPECRVIYSDLESLAAHVLGAMAGADNELASPPSVYPGIREEVFGRLADELW